MNPSIARWLHTPDRSRGRDFVVPYRLEQAQAPREQRQAPEYDPNGPIGRRVRRAARRRSADIFGGRACCGRTVDRLQRKLDLGQISLPHVEVCPTCEAVWRVVADVGGTRG